jgi:antitoxin PrlF
MTMAEEVTQYPESTLTDRYQTTVPDPVRKALGLNKRDKISYLIQADGTAVISRVNEAESDPLLGAFLAFLVRDIQANPQCLQAMSVELVNHVQTLVSGVEVDLDAPLLSEDE